jgi:tetratricopeptide (TPR) repeat protein
MDQGQLDRAEQALNEAKELCEQLVANFVSRSDDQLTLARVYISLSDILRRTGRPARAEDAFRRAWQVQETVASESPESPHWGWGVIGVWGRLALRDNYRMMGEMQARFGDYGRAATALARATEVDPNDVYCWHMRALTECAAGDSEAHRSTCREMLVRFGQTQNNYAASRIAWSCALMPDGLDDWAGPVSLTQRFVAADLGSRNSIGAVLWNLASKVLAGGVSMCEIPWHTTAAGAVLYRAGRYDEARQVMSQSVMRWRIGQPFTYDYCPGYAWCFLAMTCHQLGQEDDARAWLDRAVGRMDRYVGEDAAWQKTATLQVLLGEARALLDSEP